MSWKEEHESYINSKKWEKKRLEAFAHYGRECACCGSSDRLEVHHVSYIAYNRKGKGKEPIKDLIPLCQIHHRLIHELISNFQEINKFNFDYNWEKASKEALKYLMSTKYRKGIDSDQKSTPAAKRLRKSYQFYQKARYKKNEHKRRQVDKLDRGIGCAKGSQLRYIPNEEL
jgi:predicted restriction endonuclease